MKRVTSLLLFCAAILCGCATTPSLDPGSTTTEFLSVISDADRLVVRHGGFNCCQPVDDDKVLFSTTNLVEIGVVHSNLQFVGQYGLGVCMCCGYPGLDWYRNGERVALTSLKHGRAIRWEGFRSAAALTDASSEWIVNWLANHGVTRPREEIEAEIKRQKNVKLADAELADCIPQELTEVLELWKQQDRIDAAVREMYPDENQRYEILFRIRGCLTAPWNVQHRTKVMNVHEYLVSAPREELDRAFSMALAADDPKVKRGAAAIIYTQHYMVFYYGKTQEDIAKWQNLFAAYAMADPFPENRRVAVTRLIKDPDESLLPVLSTAISDSDQTVRFRAMVGLSKLDVPHATVLLRQVADGKVVVRKPQDIARYYARDMGGVSVSGMSAKHSDDSDEEFANHLLERTRTSRAAHMAEGMSTGQTSFLFHFKSFRFFFWREENVETEGRLGVTG